MMSMRGAKRTGLYFFVLLTCLLFWLLYLQTPEKPDQTTILENYEYNLNVDIRSLLGSITVDSLHPTIAKKKYVVNSSKCKIPNLNPFETEIMPFHKPRKYHECSEKHLLTNVTKDKNNVATLRIDKRYVQEYKDLHKCCYAYVTRGKTDMNLVRDDCVEFDDSVVLTHNIVFVKCIDTDTNDIYKNVHATTVLSPAIKKKMVQQDNNKRNDTRLSVLFVGIDSVSRMHLYRSLPKTRAFLDANDFVEFQGYNKINDNTFPNVMAAMTGLEESTAFKICNPRVVGGIDKCTKLLWYVFRKLGYITAYAEDETEINTFNYLKKGFDHDPADYYFRSYMLAAERYLRSEALEVTLFCTGPESAGERIFNVARDFTTTFKNYMSFGFFWMNSYSHNSVFEVSRMDDKIVDFFEGAKQTGVFENSLVIFLSDHGFRFGEITYTHSGWLEERLPFFYLSLPRWFRSKYPEKYHSLTVNTKRLTNPYDLYMTLQEILVLSGTNYTVEKSKGCPKCRSLFQEVEAERSCEDAAIPPHWCTCGGHFAIPTNSSIAIEVAKFLLGEVHRKIVTSGGDLELCSKFEFARVISASVSDIVNLTRRDVSYFYVAFRTYPGAVFQGTVSINLNSSVPIAFRLEGDVSRLDYYYSTSWCANDATLRKYCYCEGTWKYFYSLFRSLKKKVTSLF